MDNRTINQIRNNETKLINEIKKLEQENKKYKEVIDKAIEYINHYETIRGYYEYEENGYDEYNYENDLKQELLEILGGKDELSI